MSKFFTSLSILLMSPFLSINKAEAATKNEILKKLNFTPGRYEVMVPSQNPAPFCEIEETEIDLLEDKKVYTLIIGNNLTFAYLEKVKFSDQTKPGCLAEYTNTIESAKLEQTSVEKCKKSKKVQTIKTTLLFTQDQINLTIIENNKKQTCQYKLISQKGL